MPSLLRFPPDVRYLIYDNLIHQHETVEVRKSVMKAYVNTFSSLYLVFPEIKSNLQEWAKSLRVKFCPRIGFFDPKTTVFSFDFQNDLAEHFEDLNGIPRLLLPPDARKDFKDFSTTTLACLENLSLRFPPGGNLSTIQFIMKSSGILPILDDYLCLSSVEIIFKVDYVFRCDCRHQNGDESCELRLERLEGYWLWQDFVSSLKGTCSPKECCTCCVRPVLKLRIIEDEPGQERTVLLPDIGNREHWFVPIVRRPGGMSKVKRQNIEAATTSSML